MNSSAVRKIAVPCLLGLLFCAASVFAQDSRAFYISFKVPGSLTTSPASINNRSVVVGSFTDTNKVSHGFIRETFGRIICFDVPGSASTSAVAINDNRKIIGTYTDSSNVIHGFLRHPRGSFTTIDVAGSTGTVPTSINAFGAITGYYHSGFTSASFVRSPEGTITVFGPNSFAHSINLFGAITGFMLPAYTIGPPPPILVYGFVRSPDGVITSFVDPSASNNGTYPAVIDAFGTITDLPKRSG